MSDHVCVDSKHWEPFWDGKTVTVEAAIYRAPVSFGRTRSVAVCGAFFAVLAVLAPQGVIQLGFAASSVTLMALTSAIWLRARWIARAQNRNLSVVAGHIEYDDAASFVTCADGEIQALNPAARQAFPTQVGAVLSGALKTTFANPGGIIQRLKSKADLAGAAREDITTRQSRVRVAVHRINQHHFLWRIEPLPDGGERIGPDALNAPMLVLGRSDAVLFMNDAAKAMIGARALNVQQLFPDGPPNSGTVCQLATIQGPQAVYVMDVGMSAGRRALYLLPAPVSAEDPGRNAFEDVPVPLIRLAADGSVLMYNHASAALVGPGLRQGAPISTIMEGLGRPISDWLAETLAGRAVQNTEFLRLKRTDTEVFVQVTLNRVTSSGRASVIAVLTDATELKSLEAQFAQSQKMQAIGQLAGGVAHDFNNLLTAISGHCDLLLLRHDEGDPEYSDLMQIHQNANRAAALVGQLLAFSRKQTMQPQALDMRDTLSDLTHLLNRLVGEKVTLTLSHDANLKPIRADKRQLEQVLMNLVVNARDAMPNGGEIHVETTCLTLTEPLERDRATVPEGEYVTIRVVDEGCGIAAEDCQKVFEPFFTTKRPTEGTGLGLSTAYGIVKQTGGFIFVDSLVGEGTTFTLMFPVLAGHQVEALSHEEVQPKLAPKHADGVILLVEDEAPVRAFASRALRLRGYTVLEADSAETALKTLEDSSLSVDLFVTDVVMPGKDGPTWVREALQTRPEVGVVFVSGYAEDKLDDDKGEIPNSVFLPKPFSLIDLTETVHRQMH